MDIHTFEQKVIKDYPYGTYDYLGTELPSLHSLSKIAQKIKRLKTYFNKLMLYYCSISQKNSKDIRDKSNMVHQ